MKENTGGTSTKKKMRRIAFGFILTALVTIAVVVFFVSAWDIELNTTREAAFTIERGETVRTVSRNLSREGFIPFPLLFRILVRLGGYDTILKAGTYTVRPGTTIGDFVSDVASGRSLSDDIHVRIEEGSTVTDVLDVLTGAGVIAEPVPKNVTVMGEAYADRWILNGLQYGESLIGYLFPDTYAFDRDSDPSEVIERMLSNMEDKLTSLGIERPNFESSMGLNIHEIMTLASIVQRESVVGEMATIAGVFMNRINAGWRLESDATINFILGTNKLLPSARDIRVESPYNTYLRSGLPPGPIGNPGVEAIRAVLNPESHAYFFFLHTPDSRTILSKTFEEHLAARATHWN